MMVAAVSSDDTLLDSWRVRAHVSTAICIRMQRALSLFAESGRGVAQSSALFVCQEEMKERERERLYRSLVFGRIHVRYLRPLGGEGRRRCLPACLYLEPRLLSRPRTIS